MSDDRPNNGIFLSDLSREPVVLGARLQGLSLTRGELSIGRGAIFQVLVPIVLKRRKRKLSVELGVADAVRGTTHGAIKCRTMK